jgi:glycosyltransferase involved in cell wall biosynthesis
MENARPIFFSIVVPAHNEEGYIEATLARLHSLEYPKELYEVVVVENGSTDDTLVAAKKFESENVRVFSCTETGVSKARNFGSRQLRTVSGADAHLIAESWVLFLDADILLDPSFLIKISAFLQENLNKNFKAKKHFVAGTCALMPHPPTLSMHIMYFVANFTFRITGATYAGALFVKREYLSKISFDELLQVGEDESIAKELRREGKIFFYWSDMVHSSTRRFQNGGAKKIPVWVGMWIFAMIAPYHARITTALQRRFKYKVAR